MKMCACVHIDVIRKRVDNQLPLHTAAMIDVIKHCFTPELVAELHDGLGSSAIFQQWFLALNSRQRIRIITNVERAAYGFPAAHAQVGHVIASFYGNQSHIVDALPQTIELSQLFTDFGVEVRRAVDLQEIHVRDNPVFTLTLTAATRHSPQILKRYFSKERGIVIYDKYLDNHAARALAVFATELAGAASVLILTRPENVPSAAQCRAAMLASNNTLQIEVKAATHATLNEIHDRHIFIGNRYHLRFSSGVNVFGQKNGTTYFNFEGSVSVHDIAGSGYFLTFRYADGYRQQRICPPSN